MANQSNNESWPVTWEAVEEAPLRDWLSLPLEQRAALAEELLEFVRVAQEASWPT